MADKNGIIDYSTLDIHIGGETTAKKGLTKRRRELAAIVAPYLSVSPTRIAMQFKGRRKYLTEGRIPSKAHHAVRALSFLYGILAAIKTGDCDRIVRQSVGFARADNEVQNIEIWESDSVSALASRARSKPGRSKGGSKRSKLSAEDKAKAVYSAVAREVLKKGKESRFKKVEKGEFVLRAKG